MDEFLVPKAPVPLVVFNNLVHDFSHILLEAYHLVADEEPDGCDDDCDNDES